MRNGKKSLKDDMEKTKYIKIRTLTCYMSNMLVALN